MKAWLARLLRGFVDTHDPPPPRPPPPRAPRPPSVMELIDERIEMALNNGRTVTAIYLSYSDLNELKRVLEGYMRVIPEANPRPIHEPSILYNDIMVTTHNQLKLEAGTVNEYQFSGIILEVR